MQENSPTEGLNPDTATQKEQDPLLYGQIFEWVKEDNAMTIACV